MSETPGSYKTEKPEISPEALQTVEAFATGLTNFHWRSDYLKFCEVLGLEPSDYAEEKYQQMHELISFLKCFDYESLAKMLESGR
ncbi:hypothetical protein H6G96_32550 [Nostoc sp. FACHB-892]|uniref:hypothetical protein n=1 Tax=Nostoc sp. FACHB-892 TaxID=2692843 RepID=UPI001687A7AF|nr:hypothetical protein [Nostoc sp. FACHB-892]MBD2730923.1 hypothetical protein [Nostoc sp. FACHB-892]